MTNAAKKAAAARPAQESATDDQSQHGAAEQAGATEQSSAEAGATDVAAAGGIEQSASDAGIVDDVTQELAQPRILRARVLVHCELGEPNDVIEVEADQVAQLGDVIDTDASAVAYALSQRG
jgi:hypothetical protein